MAGTASALGTPDQSTTTHSLLEQPPSPATIEQRPGTLTVQAHNSSLAQILHQVSSKTGMQIDGLSGDERVFGSFGPGNPHDVLISLLNGTSYNVMMVGDLTNGAPRELLLTRKSGGAQSAPPPPPDSAATDAASADDQNPGPEDIPPPEEESHQADALQEQDQQQGSPDNGAPGAAPQAVRTPEQVLREIQQQQEQQQQQQPQDDQPQ